MMSPKNITVAGGIMLTLDIAAAIACGVFFLDEGIHVAFRIVLGFVAGGLIYVLLMAPYIHLVSKLVCGVAFPFVVSALSDELFDVGIGAVREHSDIAWWTIMGGSAILCVVLHYIGMNPSRYVGKEEFEFVELQDDIEDDTIERMNNLLERYNTAVDRFEVLADSISESGFLDESSELCSRYDDAVDSWSYAGKRMDGYSRRLERLNYADRLTTLRECEDYFIKLLRLLKALEDSYSAVKRQSRIRNQGADERSFFKGCENLSQLNKRYKSLAKVYHPDTGNGDSETMSAINTEYERLKARLDD